MTNRDVEDFTRKLRSLVENPPRFICINDELDETKNVTMHQVKDILKTFFEVMYPE